VRLRMVPLAAESSERGIGVSFGGLRTTGVFGSNLPAILQKFRNLVLNCKIVVTERSCGCTSTKVHAEDLGVRFLGMTVYVSVCSLPELWDKKLG